MSIQVHEINYITLHHNYEPCFFLENTAKLIPDTMCPERDVPTAVSYEKNEQY